MEGKKPEREIREKMRKEEAENGRYMAVYRLWRGGGGSLKGELGKR